jgi:hypothetical protein
MSRQAAEPERPVYLLERHVDHHRQVQYGRESSVIMPGGPDDSGPADRCHTYPEVLIRVRLLQLRRGFAT